MTNIDSIYTAEILSHNKTPHNFGELENCTHSHTGKNLACGDNITLFARLTDKGVVEQINFTGRGCALAKASASMLTQYAMGKPKAYLLEFCEDLNIWLNGGNVMEVEDLSILGRFITFKKLVGNSGRISCVMLAAETLKKMLLSEENNVSLSGTSGISTPLNDRLIGHLKLLKSDEVPGDLDRFDTFETLDLTGIVCPINFVKVKVKLHKMESGSHLNVILDNGEPMQNVPRSLELESHQIVSKVPISATQTRITVRKA